MASLKKIFFTVFTQNGLLFWCFVLAFLFFQNCSKFDVSQSESLSSTGQQNSPPADSGGNTPTDPNTGEPLTLGTSQEIFANTLYPLVKTNCSSCHGDFQDPKFATDDISSSHEVIVSLVNFETPTDSQIVLKIQSGHSGIDPLLSNDILAQIENWASQLSTDEINDIKLPLTATYASIEQNILIPKCIACHGADKAAKRIRYDSYEETMKTVVAGMAAQSELIDSIDEGEMPPKDSTPLTEQEIAVLIDWVNGGALNN